MPNIEYIEIGARIRFLRKGLKLTQSEFAQKIGANGKNTIANWENGRNMPGYEQLFNISLLANKTIDWIIVGELNKSSGSLIIEQLQKRELELEVEKLRKENESLKKEKHQLINEITKFSKVAEKIIKYQNKNK